MKHLPLALLIASTTTTAFAQDLTHKAPPQHGPIALTNAAIYPVSAEPIADGWILFEGGRITGLGAGDPASLPQGTTVIDLKNQKRVYPGLISPYTQLGLTEIQAVPQTIDMSEGARIASEVVAATAVNPDSTLIPVTRSNGILAAAVFPTGGLFSGQPSVIRLDGWTTTDMTVKRSLGQVISWPNMRTFTAWWMTESEDDQQRNIKRDLDGITKVFDTAKAYGDARAGDPSTPADLRWDAMQPLFANGPARSKLFVRANTVDQLISVASFAQRYNQDVVIIGGREAPLCASVLKAANISVIVLGTFNMPRRDDEAYDEPFTLPLRLHEAGLRFAISHNDDTAHERNLPYHAAMAVAYGLPNDIALKSVTLWSAQITGVDSTLGSLETGKSATLIVTSGDPLEITTRID
ncbi:MAG: hypothetical protein NTV94_04135, partial [Planctomycetota bacterium]|nr:hypothetical protein [Planctomycetota bacterium]